MSLNPLRRLQSLMQPQTPGLQAVGGGAAGAAYRKKCAKAEAARLANLPRRAGTPPPVPPDPNPDWRRAPAAPLHPRAASFSQAAAVRKRQFQHTYSA